MLKELTVPAETEIAAERQKCFTLYCGGEIFGLSVDHAQTIFRVASVTPIPLGRPEIVGLVNLRGKIVTAVSLRQRLKLASEDSLVNCLAIGIERNGENFALIVDQVGDVIELEAAMQIPIPAHIDQQRAQMTSGLYRVGDKLVPILDLDAILDLERQ